MIPVTNVYQVRLYHVYHNIKDIIFSVQSHASKDSLCNKKKLCFEKCHSTNKIRYFEPSDHTIVWLFSACDYIHWLFLPSSYIVWQKKSSENYSNCVALVLELLQRYLCSCMSFHSIGWIRVKDSVGSFGVPIRTRFTSEWSSMPLTLASCWRKLQGKLLTRTLFQKPYRKFCRYVTYRNKLLLYHVINHHHRQQINVVCVSETVTISPSKRNGS